MFINQNADSGMELLDLLSDQAFISRLASSRISNRETIALRRLASLFTERPDIILASLVEIAVEFCGADSAGVSVEECLDSNDPHFRWIAVAGSFSKYLNGTTPRHYSPCGTCLDSGRALHYRLLQPYYDFLGIEAEPILDGILIPWENDSMRGTIWVISHSTSERFDLSDFEMMKGLADFVSLAVQYQALEHSRCIEQRRIATASKANELAHAINNPLQAVTNSLYIAQQGGPESKQFLGEASIQLKRVSKIVADLLSQGY